MAPVIVSLTIPEVDVARVKEAVEQFTGLTIQHNEKGEIIFTPTAKELLAALIKQVVVQQERQSHGFVPPGVA